MVIILLVFLYQSLNTYVGRERASQRTLNLAADATNILLILANSADCMAYKSPITKGTYANIVDVNKLEEFARDYSDIEPECARNYEFGWRVTVKEIIKEDSKTSFGNEWSFGAANFSTGNAFKNKIEFWLPVAVRYSQKIVRPARMEIDLVDGELETIAGALDWTCQMGKMGRMEKSSAGVYTSIGMSYDKENNSLCLNTKIITCRKLLCEMEFEGLSPGEHMLNLKFEAPNKLVVTE